LPYHDYIITANSAKIKPLIDALESVFGTNSLLFRYNVFMKGEENYLYNWAGAEACWLEDSPACGVTPDDTELNAEDYDSERGLVDGRTVAVEPTVVDDSSDRESPVSPFPMRERSRNRLISRVICCVSLSIATGSVVASIETGGQKKTTSTKTEQPVNPSASKVIAPATGHIILPPNVPPANIAPSPNFLNDCQYDQYDDSTECVRATLDAIDNARSREGMSPMELPSTWYAFTPDEQLFVATNLERTDRGLSPVINIDSRLNQFSVKSAEKDTEPSLPSSFPSYSDWGSNWAGGLGNPLEAVYYWMYDDGRGSLNLDCTATDTSGCWGHRNNVLINLSDGETAMGMAFDPTADQGEPSIVEILVGT
jgi:hypothetical protein